MNTCAPPPRRYRAVPPLVTADRCPPPSVLAQVLSVQIITPEQSPTEFAREPLSFDYPCMSHRAFRQMGQLAVRTSDQQQEVA